MVRLFSLSFFALPSVVRPISGVGFSLMLPAECHAARATPPCSPATCHSHGVDSVSRRLRERAARRSAVHRISFVCASLALADQRRQLFAALCDAGLHVSHVVSHVVANDDADVETAAPVAQPELIAINATLLGPVGAHARVAAIVRRLEATAGIKQVCWDPLSESRQHVRIAA